MADDAGPLLSRAGLIGDEQLQIARQAQSGQGGTIGEHLVLAGMVDDEDLTAFFQQRLMLPRVNPNDLARISDRAIAALPPDMAAEFRVVPVSLDREKNLTIAMSDPSNTHAVDEIAFFTSMYVVRAVATQRQIAWCLAHYYGFVTPLGHTLMEPAAAEPEPAPRKRPESMKQQVEAQRRAVIPPVQALPVEISESTRSALASAAAAAAADSAVALDDDDDDDPIVEITEWDRSEPTSPTGPMRAVDLPPVQPPELAPRAGELSSRDDEDEHAVDALPAVVLEDVITETADSDSEPVVLSRPKSNSDAVPEPTPANASESVVILDRPRKRRRSSKRTRLGMGLFSSLPPGATPEGVRNPEAASSIEDAAAAVARVASQMARQSPAHPRTQKESRQLFEAVAGVRIVDDGVPDREIDDREDTQSHVSTGKYRRIDADWSDLDDGWGPPGTTIPPQYLGAISANFEEAMDHGSIPIHVGDAEETGAVSLGTDASAGPIGQPAPVAAIEGSEAETRPLEPGELPLRRAKPAPAPVKVAPGKVAPGKPAPGKAALAKVAPIKPAPGKPVGSPPPRPSPASGGGSRIAALSAAELQERLEDSSLQLVETLRLLDRAADRDAVIDCLLEYLRTSHGRACFFLVKRGVLTTYRNRAPRLPVDNRDAVNLRLDGHSTFQDLVRTRLAYKGPVKDERSRAFLVAAVGTLPAEIIALPISVRDRVVGVLYGDTPERHVFNEHATVVARAAGQAFERILKAGKTR